MGQKVYALLAIVFSVTICFADSARRTATNENISTYGGAGQGRDYTALSTWEAATDVDLVTAAQSEVLECYDDAASFDDNVDLAGATTNSSYFRIMRPATGQGHDGTSNNGFFLNSTANSSIIEISESNSQAQDIIVSHSRNDTDFRFAVQITGNGCAVIGIICFGGTNSGSGDARGFKSQGDNTFFILCLQEDNDGTQGWEMHPGSGNTTYIYNCNSIRAGNGGGNGYRNRSGTSIVKNSQASDNGTDFTSGTYTGSTNNASEDGSAPNTNEQTGTPAFINVATNNFHLDDTDTVCKNNGTDLSADTNYSFDDDIDGELFDTWDIGFDEPNSASVISSSRRTLIRIN